ncbi:MAG: hypothetical protein AAFV07_21385, partial [Bacteroidota bacterium]
MLHAIASVSLLIALLFPASSLSPAQSISPQQTSQALVAKRVGGERVMFTRAGGDISVLQGFPSLSEPPTTRPKSDPALDLSVYANPVGD